MRRLKTNIRKKIVIHFPINQLLNSKNTFHLHHAFLVFHLMPFQCSSSSWQTDKKLEQSYLSRIIVTLESKDVFCRLALNDILTHTTTTNLRRKNNILLLLLHHPHYSLSSSSWTSVNFCNEWPTNWDVNLLLLFSIFIPYFFFLLW